MPDQPDPTTGQPELGYIFYPSKHPDDPGHPRLDIILRKEPTGLHFDPNKVFLHIVSQRGEIHSLVVNHSWEGQREFRVFPCRVEIQDYLGKKHEAFTFGGGLQIQSQEEQTTCVLRSDAPIFSLGPENNVVNLFVQEVEILLAERRAAWAENTEAFEEKLSAIDPLTLYRACLDALRRRFNHYPHSEDELMQRLIHFIHAEPKSIHNSEYPSTPSTPLAELL